MKKKDIIEYQPQRTFLIQGDESQFETLLASYIIDQPMTQSLLVPRFTIDHARTMVTLMNESTGEDRVFLIYFAVFSPDAAQVLLKTLEEPDIQTTIILMTPYPYVVPKTIRSRVTLIQSNNMSPEAMKLTRTSALAFIKDAFGTESEDDAAMKRAKGVQFLDTLEQTCRTAPAKARYVYEAKDMLFAANLPTKFVLEYAASMVL